MIKHLGIVGFGQMGRELAQVALLGGMEVTAASRSDERNAEGQASVEKKLTRLVEKGKLDPAECDAALGRLSTSVRHEDFKACDAVIETIIEDEDKKRDVLASLDAILPETTLIASNTSSLSVTTLAGAASRHPERVVGMHFFNPVSMMKLVEVTRALQTSDEAHADACSLGETLGKQVVSSLDTPSFIVNRAFLPFVNEAIFMLGEGVSTAEEIDQAMKLGLNHPMGPLELSDLIGLDTLLLVIEALHRRMGDDKYRPSPVLRQYVDAGWLGRKTGRGFYKY